MKKTIILIVDVDTDVDTDKIQLGIQRGIYRGLDTEPNYIAQPSKVTVKFPEFNSTGIIPDTGKEWTVPVFFIADNQLWRGVYHQNGCFYAYGACGQIKCMASKNGTFNGVFQSSKTSVCTQWAYVDQFTFSK